MNNSNQSPLNPTDATPQPLPEDSKQTTLDTLPVQQHAPTTSTTQPLTEYSQDTNETPVAFSKTQESPNSSPTRRYTMMLIILGASLLAVAAGVVAWVSLGTQAPNPELTTTIPLDPTPSETPANSWLTTESESLRFQYPPDWKVVSEDSEYYGGQVHTLTNPSGSLAMIFYPATNNQFPYSFGNPQTEASSRNVIFRGATRTLTETIIDNTSVYSEIIVPGEYSVLFGTGYPATIQELSDLNEYRSSLETMLAILESVADVNPSSQTSTKRYRNSEYNIILEYPSQWVESYEPVSTNFDMKQLVSLQSRDFSTQLIPSFVTVSVWDNPQNLSLSEYERQQIAAERGNVLYKPESQPTKVAGVDAFLDIDSCQPVACHQYVILMDKYFLELTFFTDVVDATTIAQILSSLTLSK